MSERIPNHSDPTDPEQRLDHSIDDATGAPTLDDDQGRATDIPFVDKYGTAEVDIDSAVDPAEFAELSGRAGDHPSRFGTFATDDEKGVASHAAEIRPERSDEIGTGTAGE